MRASGLMAGEPQQVSAHAAGTRQQDPKSWHSAQLFPGLRKGRQGPDLGLRGKWPVVPTAAGSSFSGQGRADGDRNRSPLLLAELTGNQGAKGKWGHNLGGVPASDAEQRGGVGPRPEGGDSAHFPWTRWLAFKKVGSHKPHTRCASWDHIGHQLPSPFSWKV